MPRTIRSMSAPAAAAAYSSSISSGSTRLFIFITIRPAAPFAASARMRSRSAGRRFSGATSSRR